MRPVELLIPASSLEVLKIAVIYGADAVYIGGDAFGLRACADNFTLQQIADAVDYANRIHKKIYVTMNIIARNSDLKEMAKYARELSQANVHGVIVSDPGAFLTVKEAAPELCLHVSTQANNLNWRTCEFWQKLGAVRVNLARELTLSEIAQISENLRERNCPIELEAFVHGAMCMSYSGRCLISSFMTGRSANRGLCTQPCRWKYYIYEENRPGEYFRLEEENGKSAVLSSHDLKMIEHLDELKNAGIQIKDTKDGYEWNLE